MAPVARYEHLVKQSHPEQAEQLLLKTASLVKPIMTRHGWNVGTLAEMFPDNPSLLGLNVNRGAKILLRLRPHQAPDTFYEIDQLVLVMLHELTHNVHGPHDASFYKLLGELEEEWYDLKRSGYSGEGFHSTGTRLGGSHHHVPLHIGRLKALEAAERRRVKSTLMGKGGRLGGENQVGSSAGVMKSPREMAVEAAERRLRDDKSCSHDVQAEREAAKAAAESTGRDAVDLPPSAVAVAVAAAAAAAAAASSSSSSSSSEKKEKEETKPPRIPTDDDDSGRHPTPRRQNSSTGQQVVMIDLVSDSGDDDDLTPINAAAGKGTPPALADTESKARRIMIVPESATSSTSTVAPASNATAVAHTNFHANDDGSWTCPACTLHNPRNAERCDACNGLKPIDDSVGWRCEFCYQYGSEHGFWMCRNCGAIKKYG